MQYKNRLPGWMIAGTAPSIRAYHRMKLSELLSEKAILLDLKDLDKWALIARLTDLLVDSGQIPGEIRNSVHAALVDREKSMSTGMENGIAIDRNMRKSLAAVKLEKDNRQGRCCLNSGRHKLGQETQGRTSRLGFYKQFARRKIYNSGQSRLVVEKF